MRFSSRQHLAAIIAALGLLTALVSPAAAAEPLITPIAGGLDAPRHLDIAPNGAIYVTESGIGGDECIEPAPDSTACFGTTGAVTRIWKGTQSRIVSGLPSLALSGETGNDLIGPAGISVHGNGNIMVSLGEPDYRDLFANTATTPELTKESLHRRADLVSSTPEVFAERIRSDHEKWRQVISKLDLK